MRLRFALPEHTEELTMPAKQRLWLDKEERLFPGSNYPSQKHQEKTIPFPVDRSFDLATKDDSWCRNRAFSASSSDFPLATSANVPIKNEVVSGSIQHEKRAWIA